MQTRANSIFEIDSRNTDKELPIIQAWKGSSHVSIVFPDCVFASMSMKISDPKEKKFVAAISGVLHPIQGFWYFYINGSHFKNGGEGIYQLVASDTKSNSCVIGEGRLRIRESEISDSSQGGVKDNAYIMFESHWYAIRVYTDDSGALAFDVVGVSDVPIDTKGTPYAYNLITGMYHRVIAFRDESGEVAVELDSDGVEGIATFAKDSDGFYHKIEAEADDAGSLALVVGEREQ